MVRKPDIAVVSEDELGRLWSENRIPDKLAAGVFKVILSRPKEARDPRYAGQFSVIARLYTQGGQHIGTLHQIIDRQGNVLTDRHPPHPKDYTLRDCSRVRALHREELP